MRMNMKVKTRKAIFICHIGENTLRVIKCILNKNRLREFVDLEVQSTVPEADEAKISAQLKQILDGLEYKNEFLVISLPRNQATCRYLKVPTEKPQEIERIVSLQASRFLPYPAGELITGYQNILSDKEGYTHLNLIIVHKDIIEHYFRILEKCNIKNISITLSSYGLANLYDYIRPQDEAAVMVIDIDSDQVELAIVARKKLFFSRYFKINKLQANWESLFIDEIKKSYDVYVKEIVNQPPNRIILLGTRGVSQEFIKILSQQTKLAVEILYYTDKIGFSDNVLKEVRNSDISIANLIGLGLRDTDQSLNLLPRKIKEEAEKIIKQKEYLRLALFFLGIIFILGLSITKGFSNKQDYLGKLKTELNKISQEARPLEEMEKRYLLLEGRAQKKPASLEVLYELHRIMPAQVSLASLIYEEDNQVILRGETQEMNSVLMLVAALEKSAVFQDLNVRLRYATKKNTLSGEIVDFEIVCAKR
jgi:Tfp pilus assembly PilM family ATPase